MDKVDDAYVRATFGNNLPQKNVDALKAAMEKYGDNRWWESDDLVELAVHQINERILMISVDDFYSGLEIILGRPFFNLESVVNEDFREEVKLGLQRLKKKINVSEEYKETAYRKGIEMIENYCRRMGKDIIKADMSEENPGRDENGIDTSGYDGFLR